jgi:hypothetical protein
MPSPVPISSEIGTHEMALLQLGVVMALTVNALGERLRYAKVDANP